jgi:hypothetical protein
MYPAVSPEAAGAELSLGMKAPIPNCKLLKKTPLNVAPIGNAPVPAPVTPGIPWSKPDAASRMIASIRTLTVFGIACRFIAFSFSLFSIVLNDLSSNEGARRIARHRRVWI